MTNIYARLFLTLFLGISLVTASVVQAQNTSQGEEWIGTGSGTATVCCDGDCHTGSGTGIGYVTVSDGWMDGFIYTDFGLVQYFSGPFPQEIGGTFEGEETFSYGGLVGTFHWNGIRTSDSTAEATGYVEAGNVDCSLRADGTATAYKVSVDVIGPKEILIYKSVERSPTYTLYAVPYPIGGTFKWEIVDGQEKIKFMKNDDTDSVVVQGSAASQDPEDVLIKITYTIYSHSYEFFHKMTIQRPGRLVRIALIPDPKNPPVKNKKGEIQRYHYLSKYQILDQLDGDGTMNPPDPMLVQEQRSLCYTSVKKRWLTPNVNTLTYEKRNDILIDGLGFPEKGLYEPSIPRDFFVTVNQFIKVAGWEVGTWCQIYYYDHVDTKEGTCGGCPKLR
jgi:hypothetical protein